MPKPRHLEPPKRRLTPEDVKQAETVKAAGQAAIDTARRILESEPQKKLRDLGRHEFEKIAEAAVIAWILKRQEIGLRDQGATPEELIA